MKRETVLEALEHVKSKLEEKEIVAIQESENHYMCPKCAQIFERSDISKYGYKYCFYCGQRVDFTIKEEKKPYNGKLVCIESKNMYRFTEGRIYPVIDGKMVFDDGTISAGTYSSFEEIQEGIISKFIEVKGEQKSQFYTGKAICLGDVYELTKGKIYNVVDGRFIDDLDNLLTGIRTFEGLEDITDCEFLEIKE